MVKLIRTNLRRHRTVDRLYVLMAAGMIAVLYAVLALIDAPAVLGRTVDMNDLTAAVPALLVGVLVVILLFTIVFLLYMNAILIERRTGNIRVYRLLGMPGGRLGLSLFCESLVLGGASVLLGVFGGWLFSKFMAMLLLRLMGIHQAVGMLWSPRVAGEIAGLFLVVYAVLGGINALYAGNLALLQGPQAKEQTLPRAASGWRVGVAWLGGVILAVSYLAAFNLVHLTYAMAQRFIGSGGWTLLAVPTVGIIGLYLVFRISLPTLFGWLQKRPQVRRNAVWLLTVADLHKRLVRNAHSLFLTSVLATITMTVLGSGAILYQFGQRSVTRGVALDMVASAPGLRTTYHQLEPQWIRQTVVLPTKLAAGQLHEPAQGTGDGDQALYNVIALSDYTRVRKIQRTLPPLKVAVGQGVMILFGRTLYQHTWLGKSQDWSLTLTRTHQRFSLKQVTSAFPLGEGAYFDRALVVADRDYQALFAPLDSLTAYKLANSPAAHAYAERENNAAPYDYVRAGRAVLSGKKTPRIQQTADAADYSRRALRFRAPMMTEMNVVFGMGLFIVILLGAVFIVATASILLIKQLMIASEERRPRQALRALGIPQAALQRITAGQVGVVFALPLLFGAGNSGLIIRYLSMFLNDPGYLLVTLIILVYVIVYLVFAVLTVRLTERS